MLRPASFAMQDAGQVKGRARVPTLKNRTVFEVARGLKAFLNLEVGLTRGPLPDPGRRDPGRGLEQARKSVKEKDRRIARLRKRLEGQGGKAQASPAANGQGGFREVRRWIAHRYLAGDGLEVGALHQPLEVPPAARVRYVDRMTVEQLRGQYPELAGHDLTPVDILDDGETLSSVDDSSVDFVIANHMLEHCENPIGAIENQLRVLKPDGVLYMAVPDKRFTFDRDRPVTSLEHLVRDYEEGPAWSRDSHFEEWARLMDKVPEEGVAARARQIAETDFSIHFHTWTQEGLLRLLLHCRSELRLPFEVELLQRNASEIIFVLRKWPEGSERGLILREGFRERGPWVTKFVIDGVEYGGGFNAMQDTRLEQFFGAFPDAAEIMELGSLEGGHTFGLARRPSVRRVLGIEGRQESVDKAEFVRQALGVTNAEFVTANLEETDLATFGRFDAVFCSGLLYHLPRPWELIEQISRVSPNLFVWTHYVADDEADTEVHGLRGWYYKEHGLADPLSGMSPDSFWPTLGGLQDMLKEYGYGTIHLIEDDPDHPQGPAITLAAAQR
jgi:SAM-dependent methyltransferase